MQVKVDVVYGSPMNSDFGDVRFVNASNTPLNYWLETYSTSSSAIFWVKTDSLAPSATTTIYMYYGNSATTTQSSLANTFINNTIYLETRRCLDATNCNTTDSHNEFDSIISSNYALDGSGYRTAADDPSNPYGSSDNYFSRYRFLFLATTTGSYGFGVNTDDAGEVHRQDAGDIDSSHQVLASWYGGHGTGSCGGSGSPGTATLTAGSVYWLELRQTEWGSGNYAQMCIRNPGSSFQTVSAANFPGQLFARQIVATSTDPSVVLGEVEIVSSLIWSFYDNPSVSSSSTIASVLLPASNIQGTYQEGNNTAFNPYSVAAGQYLEYDFALDPTNISLDTPYYFRLVRADGSVLDVYDSNPTITLSTEPPPPSYRTVTWDGGAGTNNWIDALNWDTDEIPTTTDDVIIPGANVTLSATTTIHSLNYGTTGSYTLTINAGRSLIVTATTTLTDG
jgi:hypothetical protein